MKKFLSMLLVVVLTASICISGTMAYLQEDDSDVNVMTLGKVAIEQLEYERVVENGAWVSTGETDKYGYTPDKVQEFTQEKPLYPAVFADGIIKWDDRVAGHQQSWDQVGASGSNQLFDDSVKGVIDKFVFVKNTGKSDAYVRTFIALEQGDIAGENFTNVIMTNSDKDHWSYESVATDVVIDGNKYVVLCYTYLGPKSNPTGILAPGTVSYPSLLQVYMRPEATNEDVEAIDGNGNGTYDILVLSQAVQTAGFESSVPTIDVDTKSPAKIALDTAFGEPTNDNIVEWFGEAANDLEYGGDVAPAMTVLTIDSFEEFKEFDVAVDTNGEYKGVKVANNTDVYVKLNTDIDLSDYPSFTGIGDGNKNGFDGVFNGYGHTIKNWTVDANWNYYCAFFRTTANLDVKNVTFENFNLGTGTTKGTNYGVVIGAVGGTDVLVENVTVKDCVVKAQRTVGAVVGGITNGKLTIKDCTVENVDLHNAGNDTASNRVAGIYLGNGWSHHDAEADGIYLENNTASEVTWIAGGVEQTIVPEYTYNK